MGQPDNTSWLGWLAAVPGAVLLFLLRRILNSVSRAELREAILDAQQIVNDRHAENRIDTAKIKEDVAEVRSMVSRIEGQLSGRYPNLGKRG